MLCKKKIWILKYCCWSSFDLSYLLLQFSLQVVWLIDSAGFTIGCKPILHFDSNLLCIPVRITVVLSPLWVVGYFSQGAHGWRYFTLNLPEKFQPSSLNLCVRRFPPLLLIVCRAYLLCIHLFFCKCFQARSVLWPVLPNVWSAFVLNGKHQTLICKTASQLFLFPVFVLWILY